MSDGEKLCFCVDVANLQKKALNLILIDGVEKLSPENRKMLYAKCKEKGVQFICTRTTKDTELIVVEI
jgi:DTW domain-containing protein YfiP